MLAASGALPVVAASGRDTSEPLTLERCIYLILRVQEGTQQVMHDFIFTYDFPTLTMNDYLATTTIMLNDPSQEERLINTGM